MRRYSVVLCILLMLPLSVLADPIRLTADVWPPYTMDPRQGREGYLIELARAVFEVAGYQVSYEIRPYARGIQQTQNGQMDGVVGIYREDALARDLLVPGEILGVSENVFFVRKGDRWQYDPDDSERSLQRRKIGVIKDYVFAEIQTYLQQHKHSPKVQYVHGEAPLEKNLKKLRKDRIDTLIDDRIVVLYTATKLGMAQEIAAAGSLHALNPVVIGFSRANPDSPDYARILSEGIRAMRANGQLQLILDRYAIDDWQGAVSE
ncbi:substrate-binding periplasmic protein [Neptuniibacter halophilus]|uniref:substrate-binding periplasmic protein n=1 Tax=Neptuniibacter halophilus TaxID=651666 RepID=UPI002572636C|nr:transporter substrate-binding domain-containing protein [Neptuniibacter halophilus]